MSRHCILVTSGEHRSSLAVVRSLGRHGHRLIVAAQRGFSLAGSSRYASAEIIVPSPTDNQAGFADAIVEATRRFNVDVVIPTTDDSLLSLLPARSRLAPAVLPVGSEASYRAASDKALLQSIASRFGIAVPRQIAIDSPREIKSLEFHFPAVVKPSRSVSDGISGLTRHVGVRYAANEPELLQLLAQTPEAAYPLLVQERIVGPGVGVFFLIWEGEELAVFSHRRLREKPPGGGVSVYAESVAPDSDLVARSKALLSHLDFQGVAMVEYKIDRETGVPYLMEINGRFWGSLQLAIDSGVNFPQLLVSAAVDGIRPPRPTTIPGVTMRWWWGDFDHLLARLRKSQQEGLLPPDTGSRWQAVKHFLRIRWGERNQVLRWNDPMPAVTETIDWLLRR